MHPSHDVELIECAFVGFLEVRSLHEPLWTTV